MSCIYCTEWEDLPEHYENDLFIGRVFDTCIDQDAEGRWHIEVGSRDIGIRYCPMCGRELPIRMEQII